MKILDQHTGERLYVPEDVVDYFYRKRKKVGLIEIVTPSRVFAGDYDNYGGVTMYLNEPVYVCRHTRKYKVPPHVMLRVQSGERDSEMARAVGVALTELEQVNQAYRDSPFE